MKFKSDSQRRACFFNLFSKRGKSNLELFEDDLGRLRVSSNTTANTSFLLNTDLDPVDAKKFISQLDEDALAGIKKVSIVKPSVLKLYNANSGFYDVDDERVPFGKMDIPKIIVSGETRGRKSDTFIPKVSKDIARSTFQNIYHNVNKPDEYGISINTELPKDLLEEEYLLQVYNDYKIPKEKEELMIPLKNDLEDEVWRLRSIQRLNNPSVMESRAWRMGKKPRVDLDTFVDIPTRKYTKRDKSIKNVSVEKKDKNMDDIYKDLYESTKYDNISDDSWMKDSEISFKITADMMLSGKFEMVSRMDNYYIDNMLDYLTGHWNPAYGVIRERLIAEKQRRNLDV